jgi:hypothetical protein
VKGVPDIETTADQSPAPAEDEDAQPIVIRRLDRLETTLPSNPSGN